VCGNRQSKAFKKRCKLLLSLGSVLGKIERTVMVRGDPEWVRTACEGSLKRLDVDYIDLHYQVWIDSKVPDLSSEFVHQIYMLIFK